MLSKGSKSLSIFPAKYSFKNLKKRDNSQRTTWTAIQYNANSCAQLQAGMCFHVAPLTPTGMQLAVVMFHSIAQFSNTLWDGILTHIICIRGESAVSSWTCYLRVWHYPRFALAGEKLLASQANSVTSLSFPFLSISHMSTLHFHSYPLSFTCIIFLILLAFSFQSSDPYAASLLSKCFRGIH